ncbi:hypothetical protein [Solimonas sp. SE-A11]|uniref:hypothetical protein n=1 Tax=Solimonas sp. SE-A11 TaxID=3054954 RepID=UPI00259CAFFA|nr:hypothetical protein [Solimonas sp. SE-A11]MDM4772972.1 hypothetical protein [Solimonas sp. SE-A11]
MSTAKAAVLGSLMSMAAVMPVTAHAYDGDWGYTAGGLAKMCNPKARDELAHCVAYVEGVVYTTRSVFSAMIKTDPAMEMCIRSLYNDPAAIKLVERTVRGLWEYVQNPASQAEPERLERPAVFVIGQLLVKECQQRLGVKVE